MEQRYPHMDSDTYIPPTKKRRGLQLTPRVGFTVLTVALMALSFGAGIAYQKGKSPTASAQNAGNNRFGQFGNGQSGPGGFDQGNRAFGTVSSVSDTSISVSMRSGSTATYTITSSTKVTDNGNTASISDIQTGDTVVIALNSSDSKTATSIMLNPSFGGPMGSNTSTQDDSSSDSSTQSI